MLLNFPSHLESVKSAAKLHKNIGACHFIESKNEAI